MCPYPRWICWLTIGLVLVNTLGVLPARAISTREEEELGKEFMKIIRERFEFVEDSLVVDYVNQVGQRVVAALPNPPFPYRFHVIREDVFNAFATPAGNVFIYSGLLSAMESEEELAGLLAHEIAHVHCRHISEKIERSKKLSVATLAGVVAGILLGIGGVGEAAQALTVGSMAAGQSAMLAYSRSDEAEADQIGLSYLYKAGYGGEGLVKVFEKIMAKRWFGPKEIPTYVTTHPAVEDRIVDVRNRVADIEARQGHPPAVDPIPFLRAQTRLLANYGDEFAVLKRFEAALAQEPDNSLRHYQYGLILARVGRRDEAAQHLQRALVTKAFDPLVLVDLGKIYFLDGRYEKALKTLESAVQTSPGDPEGLFYLGRTQLELGAPEKAVPTFTELVQAHPEYNEGYFYLGKTYSDLGQPAEAYYYLGRHHHLKGAMKNAAFQYERALKATTDPARRQELEKLLAEVREATEKKKTPPAGGHPGRAG
jgi:predicted Zn-dependent protease